jgi:hypothetical protein
MVEIDEPHVRLRVLTICDDAAVLQPADQLMHHRMVGAHHRKAVERQVLDEGAKRFLYGLESLEMIEMLRIDIGDDGDIGRQLEESAVGLVGLHHHPVAAAEPSIGAVGLNDASVDHGRIESLQERRHQRRGRGLAMRARNGNAALEPHQFGEHFRAPHHRHALGARGNELRIVALDGSRHDNHLGVAEIVRRVPDRDGGALLAQPLDVGVLGRVRALHRIAEINQHFGDPAHADAADADEVDRTDIGRELHASILMILLSSWSFAPDRPAVRQRRARPAGARPRP